MWIALALLVVLLTATRDLFSKKLLSRDSNPLYLYGTLFLCSGIILALVIAITGMPLLGQSFFSALLISLILNGIATVCLARSLMLGDLSLVAPLLSFTAVFTVVTSYLILDERPSLLGFFGIVLIVLGSYAMHLESLGESFGTVFSRIRSNHAGLYMLAVAFLYSVSANFDKIGSLNSSPVFYSAALDVLLGVLLLLLIPFPLIASDRRPALKDMPSLIFLGALFAIATCANFTAFTMTIVPYVTALTRTAALFSVVFGVVFLKEHSGMWRITGAGLMLAGIMCIVL